MGGRSSTDGLEPTTSSESFKDATALNWPSDEEGHNLLRNPSGNEGFDHWQVKNGGDGWKVCEIDCCLEGVRAQTCFSSSFSWCVKSQEVDLLEEELSQELLDNQPEICISDWYAPHPGYEGIYQIRAQLLSEDRRVIATFKKGPARMSGNGSNRYRKVSHVFRGYGPGLRYVLFEHKAKDVLHCAGNYGPRVTNSSVMVKSRGTLRPTRDTSAVTFWMDLEALPDEVLLNVLSFVPASDLVLQCRLVCHKWQELVDGSTLWRLKYVREQRKQLQEAVSQCPGIPWSRMYVKDPFSRNLLRNPCGTEKMKHWQSNDFICTLGLDYRHVDAAAFWCVKWQVVDLLKEGLSEELLDHLQPEICISDWYGGRADCGCLYEITEINVKLLASDSTRVIAEYREEPESIPQWKDQHCHQVSHVFREYGRGVRFIKFLHKGKDTQFWAGHDGARTTNSSVTVRVPARGAAN